MFNQKSTSTGCGPSARMSGGVGQPDGLREPLMGGNSHAQLRSRIFEILRLDESIKHALSIPLIDNCGGGYEHGGKRMEWRSRQQAVRMYGNKLREIISLASLLHVGLIEAMETSVGHKEQEIERLKDAIQSLRKASYVIETGFLDFIPDENKAGKRDWASEEQRAFVLATVAMSKEFELEAAKEILGFYTLVYENVAKLAQKAGSFNELLHLVHRFVTESLPMMAGKSLWKCIDGKGGAFSMGVETAEFRETLLEISNITASFYDGEITGGAVWGIESTDMGNPALTIQVRDVGHALSIIITKQPDGGFFVNYTIPKPYERRHVEDLEGFEHYEDVLAAGAFMVAPNESLAQRMAGFVAKVPALG